MWDCRFRPEALEEAVHNIVTGGVLPEGVVAPARAELRRHLETPDVANVRRQRARLTTRLEKLKQQHSWGDITDEV